MKVLVVGGSGFIGSRLIRELRGAGHQVTSFDLLPHPDPTVDAVIGDVCDSAALVAAGAGCDAIVNLAAEHRDDVRPISRYDLVNVGGAASLTKAAAELGVEQILFTSSVALYGLDAQDPTEDTPAAPFNDYGRTKLAAEKLLITWAEADAARGLLIIRPCVVFGEGNRGNVYNLIAQISSGKFVTVGDGSNRKSMAYVGNLVQFLIGRLPIERGVRTFNYADKPDLTTRELVTVVRQTLGGRTLSLPSIPLWMGLAAGSVFDGLARLTRRTFPVSRIRVVKFTADTRVDSTAAMSTGFQAPTELPEALRRTIASEFPDRIRA